ncbi:MAG: hypothetical protein UT41_C0001G0544 [Candidatus Wolfebacteria bacterium GW2011_GWC2_39_22]|uniref:Uncharacterized protein n=1 Tax=Candidatus Wolfebacteria bacterium GW2011_GWC2_39_22 TaxID=1619013 RepID=A0A0G0QRJ0_9BACT|nr:MAG: hypothetical protein UT41_C0001G0544 [Candidatus Wolfebacteria bacterium GW2011_GWC2_39_22]HBI25347.1 hypothetical protein [Candidatus Wolfebacteria bacterium]
MKKAKKNAGSGVKMAAVGAGLAGLAATAYFFFGPKGVKNQKHAKAWAIKMKGDVVEKLEMAKEISEPVYAEIIDSVAATYAKGRKASAEEIIDLAKDLKKHWKTINSSAKATKKDAVKSVKNVKAVVKKAVKKVAKKGK